jgi:hypothetical protein
VDAFVLFLLGWLGLSFGVLAVVVVLRARHEVDPMGPGTRRAKRCGCTCSLWKNCFGWREAVTGTSYLARGCPVMAHHPEVRRRMFVDQRDVMKPRL